VSLVILIKDPPGIAAGTKDRSLRYTKLPLPVDKTQSTSNFLLPTDAIAVDPGNKQSLLSEFDNVYVKKGVSTDCSFTSAFMLMYEHDADYPYKVLRHNSDRSYLVNFPGYKKEMLVSPDDIAKFNSYIKERGAWKSFLRDSHSVAGINILRNAYYRFRRNRVESNGKYQVYGGGIPINDLLMLSGVGTGHVIAALHENQGSSFAEEEEISYEVNLKDGVINNVIKEGPKEYGNPLATFDDLSNYMIVLASARVIDNSFGTNIIAGHAYYLKGTTADGKYVLGNSYNTKNVVILDVDEFLEKFSSIHYIQIYKSKHRDR
jgi:hypothetical protein